MYFRVSLTMASFNFNVLSLNVRGLQSDVLKRMSIFNWLKRFNCSNSIVFLQETHSSTGCEQMWKRDWGSDIFYSHGTTDSRGVAILFPKQLDYSVTELLYDDRGRYLLLDCLIDGSRFILVNIYAPTKNHLRDQCQFLADLKNALEPYSGENLILGGDFNTVIDPALGKKGGRGEPESQYMKDLKALREDFDLADVWRGKKPHK